MISNLKKILSFAVCLFLLAACTPPIVIDVSVNPTSTPAAPIGSANPPAASNALPSQGDGSVAKSIATPLAGAVATAAQQVATSVSAVVPATGSARVPNFDHIALILFENHGFSETIGNPQMPNLNSLAKQNALLGQYFAVRHPSLPNYIALMGGDTFGIKQDCTNCFLNQPNLADRIEGGGKTWRDYQQDMPAPCFTGNANPYYQKHNPFLYFDNIRLDSTRCAQHVVPLTQLDADLAANKLPNFVFIMPNICNSGHDCGLDMADQWLGGVVSKLQSSPAFGKNSLIIITFDEAEGQNGSCCGMTKSAGGQVATVLVSSLVKPGFEDTTPYSHYSLLKTILMAWGLPDLGNTSASGTQPILAVWK